MRPLDVETLRALRDATPDGPDGRGLSVRRLADALGVSRSTARRRLDALPDGAVGFNTFRRGGLFAYIWPAGRFVLDVLDGVALDEAVRQFH